MRIATRGLRLVILAAFAVFFVVPIFWLILAPTKSDGALVTRSPLSFGSFHQIVLAWDHLDGFSDHIYRLWIGNSLLYAFSATAIVLVTAIPAGYGLALGDFPGRKLVLTLTLVVMIMPAAALVLPIFLELNLLHLIGSALSACGSSTNHSGGAAGATSGATSTQRTVPPAARKRTSTSQPAGRRPRG